MFQGSQRVKWQSRVECISVLVHLAQCLKCLNNIPEIYSLHRSEQIPYPSSHFRYIQSLRGYYFFQMAKVFRMQEGVNKGGEIC